MAAMRKLTQNNIDLSGGKRNFAVAVDPKTVEKVVAVTVSRLNLASYVLDPYFQVSREIVAGNLFDLSSAQSLAEILEDDESDLDPIDVFEVDGKLYLVHGFARDGAYRLAGRQNIPAIVYKGSRVDAYEFALKCNAKPVRPLTNADKWKRVRAAFLHFGFNLSNGEIARKCEHAVSTKFCRNVRVQMEAEAAEAAAAEGKLPEPENIAQPDIRMVTRGDKTYAMKTTKIGKATSVPAAKVEPPAPKAEPSGSVDKPVEPVAPTFVAPVPPKPVLQNNGHYTGTLEQVAEMPDLVTAGDDELVTLIISRGDVKYLRLLLAQEYDKHAVDIKHALEDV